MLINFKNLTDQDIYPDLNNEKYKNLLERYMHSKHNDSDEFIISEALRVYADLDSDDYDRKIRILELLKDTEF